MLYWSRKSCRKDPHQVDSAENPTVEVNAVRNFLKNIKDFISKNAVLFVNYLNFNNDENWD